MPNLIDDSQLQAPEVFVEGTWLYGAFATTILYGIGIVLYAMCTRSLWHRIRRSREGARRIQWFLFIYVNFIFALSTLFVVSNCQIMQLGFINNRDYPGGPSAYESNISSAPLNIAFVLSNWCTDALMIWRCHVVYRDSRFHFCVATFAFLLLLASVVTGSMWVIVVSLPAQSTAGWMSFTLLFPYLCVSLAINIIISILTVLRLLYYRARISKTFGPEYGVLYASFATMIVESAAVYSICSLMYLIPYAVNSPLANTFSQILGEVQIIAPLLIIYRVSEGKAWTRDLGRQLASSSSYVLRGLSTRRTANSLEPPRPVDQVVLQGAEHIECGSPVRHADEESKGSTLTPLHEQSTQHEI